MENQPPVDRPTIRAHKAQFVWQILIPVILVVVILSGAGAVVIANAISDHGQIRLWADISLIWVLAPVLLFTLMCLLIVITIIYGMAKVLQYLPRYTGKTQEFFSLFAAGTRKLADGATRPIVWFRQAGAVIKSIFRMK
jgi:hypothetical protein